MRKSILSKSLVSSIVLQLMVALSGFVLPHLIISVYGSQINGMISTITQFLSYIAMVESGIRAASLVELYKPLAENDEKRRNEILSATKTFYLKTGLIYSLCLIGLMLLYPYFVKGQVDTNTARWMILILASSNVVDYFILGKYQVLLAADRKTHVIYYIQAIGTLLNLVISILLIYHHNSVLLVKLSGTLAYTVRTFAIIIYVEKHYHHLEFNIRTKEKMLPQRWNAFIHQIAGVICNNTDLVLITLLLGAKSMAEASVYYVYNLASSMFSSLFNSVSSAIIPYFGNLISQKEENRTRKLFDLLEFIYYIIVFTLYTCMFCLMTSFVEIYTNGAKDAEYYRPMLSILFVLMGVIQNVRIPSMMIICAAGHYKETQSRAIIEASINLGTSIVLIKMIGIEGAVIGTICAFLYRSTDSIVYCSKHFMKGMLLNSFMRICRNIILMILLCFGIKMINLQIKSWFDFILLAIPMTICTGCIYLLFNLLFEKKKKQDIAMLIKHN